jgi:hypothetical protein
MNSAPDTYGKISDSRRMSGAVAKIGIEDWDVRTCSL